MTKKLRVTESKDYTLQMRLQGNKTRIIYWDFDLGKEKNKINK